MNEPSGTVSTGVWAKRIILEISQKQLTKLRKGKRALVMRECQLYEIKGSSIPEFFDAKGKAISMSRIKNILKKIK